MNRSRKSLNPRVKPQTGQSSVSPMGRWLGERALRIETHDSTLARYALLKSIFFAELEDIIPSDGSILLVFKRGASVSEALRLALAAPLADMPTATARVHQIEVHYGGEAGPDLVALADLAGLGVVDYINSHAAVEYTVAFLGFQPGFPYLSGLPHHLHAPRRASPRVRVAAGSVAIGGGYTGIYPASGPGGWQIIGRTTAVLFDLNRHPPALMMPGDRVRFVAHD